MINHSWPKRVRQFSLYGCAVLALSACNGNDDDVQAQETPPAAPAAPAVTAMAAARVHYFGAENVDAKTGEIRKDLLIMSWVSNTTYAAP